ncbi:type I pantothenate kinase [Diaphorobacter aerolatus]|uniref:type I pantothenate kinase n=1 Tax=Diaphorobacter aerolatus TaxID=1288495 RepID=UPI001D002B6C|nr:type I pantothenate kinase [Diaphorobacter aerolatus]
MNSSPALRPSFTSPLHTAVTPPRVEPPYVIFDRSQWAALRSPDDQVPSRASIEMLGGVNDPALQIEVEEIFLPLTRFINAHIRAAHELSRIVYSGGIDLGSPIAATPYVIGVAGSVAVGKSTFARLLRAVLSTAVPGRRVELVTTDGFLYPTRELQERALMGRKGFPDSYDLPAMLEFLSAVKSGKSGLKVPVYSHEAYDVVPDEFETVNRPDILIFEGLNVLQTKNIAAAVASDFFDFSIYLDAESTLIERWYIERFLKLQRTVFQRETSYFHHYKDLSESEATQVARGIWQQINLPNLLDNIEPTRGRARIVLRKGEKHQIEEISVRQT